MSKRKTKCVHGIPKKGLNIWLSWEAEKWINFLNQNLYSMRWWKLKSWAIFVLFPFMSYGLLNLVGLQKSLKKVYQIRNSNNISNLKLE